jgi:hypothetical protein
MLRSLWRQALVVVLFLLIASCSGGGCSSGCSSCGITPIAGGFPPDAGISNSASVRVTKSGLTFLSNNLPSLAATLLGRSGTNGVIDFDIPTSTTTLVGQTLTICPNGSNAGVTPLVCIAEIKIGGAVLTLNAVTPDAISISGTIPVRVQDIVVNSPFGAIDIGVGSGLSCDTTNGGVAGDAGFLNFPISITLPLVAETIPPRLGYTKIGTPIVTSTVTGSDIIACCTTTTPVIVELCNGLLSALTGTVASSLGGQLNTVVGDQISAQLCTKANAELTPPCPYGTSPAGGDGGLPAVLADGGVSGAEPNCVYDADAGAGACLPIELGLEGHMNLGALLASISPGTTGALDFALAANGNMIPAPGAAADGNGNTPNGMTLGMLGGGLPMPQSECVPVAPNVAPTGLVIPNQMLTDDVTGYGGDAGVDGGPDLGVAIDQQFLNYFLGSAYNSGVLCLGITTEKYQQLNTGTVSLLIPTLKTLTFEEKSAAIAITTRPQKPPVLVLGGGTNITSDPLINLTLPSFALDFYVWSEDRYIRGFTFTADVTIPMNIQSSAAGIQPVIGTLVLANSTVTNNVLITDSASSIASGLSGVLGSLVGQLLGSGIPPINLASALSSYGLTFTIPPGGIQTITQANDAGGTTESYLGLFGNLGTVGSAAIRQMNTHAEIHDKTVHPEAMTLTTMTPALAPTLHVTFGAENADGSKPTSPVEYSWQIDQGTFSAWSTADDVVIRDPMLWMQAKHTLQVTSRLAGVIASQDMTPVSLPFTIDVLPPMVTVQQQDLGWSISAWDVVSPSSALVARTRGTDKNGKVGEWTDWQPLANVTTVPASYADIDVQVRDEEENVGSVSSALIRGNPDPTLPPSGGCSSGACAIASQRSGSGWPAFVLGLASLSLLTLRRRGRGRRTGGAMLALGSIVTVAATSQGCSCGKGNGAEGAGLTDGGTPEGGLTGQPVCGQGCNQPCGPSLPQGLIGAYTSIAQAADGTLWVAGYNDAAVDPTNGIDALYGDLVVGKYDTTSSSVKWVTVDGLPPPLPDDVCPPNDPTGWRGGLLDSGPDVGLWTSIILDASGHPMVSYYDATNQALKFASSQDGVTWSTHAVFANAGSDAGRYAKMTIINGNPVIAYLVVETGTNGYSTTKVSLAHATKALPAAPSDWQTEDALVDTTSPCRAQDCAAGQACDIATMVCTTVSTDCDAACATGEACITTSGVAACTKVAAPGDIHPYPQAVGDYINISPITGGIGLLVYDRIHGNLLGLTNASGSWVVTILDGETGSRAAGTAVDTGDDGVGASLFVAQNGDWHASYVDGISETLKYLYIPGGTLLNTLTPQIVDTGYNVDGANFTDGMHIIGDDSNVRENSDGSITITYMDATVGTLRLATGSSTPGTWTLHAISQPNEFGGFFPHFEPASASIANWWRWADPTTQVISGNVAVVTP